MSIFTTGHAMSGLDLLEEMFRTDDVQERLSRFMHKEACVNSVFVDTDITAEQRLEYTEVHIKYCEMLEQILQEFFEAHPEHSKEEVLEELSRIDNSDDTLVCAPYIAAGIDYKNFVALVQQWKESYDSDAMC
eukprot:TRINITY_DN8615_c0_g1_i1.p1 TRINITY_DN8615_c0_g1~~TRINITY_DN8615_c0_g1_i1.p1  ORF type:complete len:133 (+),score=60.26 TRINITY_DN8615_c0_g1_i1:398-796(+)